MVSIYQIAVFLDFMKWIQRWASPTDQPLLISLRHELCEITRPLCGHYKSTNHTVYRVGVLLQILTFLNSYRWSPEHRQIVHSLHAALYDHCIWLTNLAVIKLQFCENIAVGLDCAGSNPNPSMPLSDEEFTAAFDLWMLQLS